MESLNEAKPKKRLSNSNLLFLIASGIFVLMYGFAIISFPGSFMQFQTFFDLLT
jgi:simple sugar transport system permease protein